ncbi:HD domain-containing protein [Treponema parvum]|uniref:HD domain-containing protein n=1 Tax=Treponema parvum TaxID=138851 RepID=A0A975F080_9SPIR|nr:HD domain-containing protein [Treponema parvum]QTQ11890.1 HD domain-containing protein [Treponema parvum]
MRPIIKHIKIPHILKKMNELFTKSGFEAYLVGGAVRDTLLHKNATDWDIATNATPEQVMAIFHRVIPTGIEHGTVTVFFMGSRIEVTTYRTDAGYSDGRHPDKVIYTSDINEDLSRRDFTMNAVAVNLSTQEITDPFKGRQDIKRKIIRTVGDPVARFTEDGLRPVRALRFSAQLGFVIENETFKAISLPEVKKKTAGVSIERFRDEFIKMLGAPRPSIGLVFMEITQMLEQFFPELALCRGCKQSDIRGFHDFDVLDHLFYACDGAPQDDLTVRLAALFHDVGKPLAKKTEKTEKGEIFTFYNHESISADITKNILTRLRFPNATVDSVCHLIRQHMFHYESSWTDAAVRRFIVRVKPEYVERLFELRLADIYGMHNMPVRLHDSDVGENLSELKERISDMIKKSTALGIKDLAVNGQDLMSEGIPSGKDMGKILNSLLESVLDDPAQNNKETLLNIAKSYYRNIRRNDN